MRPHELLGVLENARKNAEDIGFSDIAETLRKYRDRMALKHYGEPWCHHESRREGGRCECGDVLLDDVTSSEEGET